jgi:uncharacterized repeat protein (TIGR03806 family)
MDAADKTQFAARVIPYQVNSPLWSDSADKRRGMVIPAGQTVHVKDCSVAPGECLQGPADTGKWLFPVGTVMLKSFLFDDKVVETRLFVRHDAQTWVGYSYQWDEAQTDATIVPDERRTVLFDTGTRSVSWTYPSRTDCMKCHNPAGGFTLGPETRQMNRTDSGLNQIDRLAALPFFEQAPSTPYQAALATPFSAGAAAESAAIADEARSYLHANCAFCHRPDDLDLGEVDVDLRFDVALKATRLCNADPVKGDQGVPSAKLLIAGQPQQSITWLRMNALPNNGRMPQVGTYQVHVAGVHLIGDWISSLQSCL